MPTRLPGKHVLIVEDHPALAFDLDDSFRDHGAHVVGPALDLPTALDFANEAKLDVAILDIDLGTDFVWPVAYVLRDRRVPFVFVSAECRDRIPKDLSEVVCLEKPAHTLTVLRAVADALTVASS